MYYLYIFNIYIISNLYTMYKPQRIKKHHEGSLHILQYIKKYPEDTLLDLHQ